MQTRGLAAALIVLSLLGCSGPAESLPEPTSDPAALEPQAVDLTPTESLPAEALTLESPEELPPTEAPAETGEPEPAAGRPTGQIIEFDVPAGSHPHDVAPAPDGSIWYTSQLTGHLGILDPATGEVRLIALPAPSAPHGVIAGPDGAAWITDSGHNAIVRVDPAAEAVQVFDLPPDRPNANLNTAAFDGNGILWFTGQNGIYGRLDPATGEMQVFDARARALWYHRHAGWSDLLRFTGGQPHRACEYRNG